MGIGGLLPLLASVTETVHISKYEGKKVAIDTYVWLHKAAYNCSEELCRGIPTTKYIDYCMKRIHMMKHHNITPIMVFDGGLLPAKKKEEGRRYQIRKEYKERANKFLKENNLKAAQDAFKRAVDISPRIAQNLIKHLQKENIDFIVAPYEADAQLAYLSYKGLADVIITEDSDMLPYGCKTILFKLDNEGNGKEIQSSRINQCMSPISFEGFTMPMFRQMCILSGCDYLSSPAGLGIRGAHNLIKSFKNYEAAVMYIRESRLYSLSSDYEEKFTEAELTFLYQRVWDPLTQEVVHLHSLPPSLHTRDLSFLGGPIVSDLGYKIATGLVNPHTHQSWDPRNSTMTTKATIPQSTPKRRTPIACTPTQISVFHTPQSKQTAKPFSVPRKKGNAKTSITEIDMMPVPNLVDLATVHQSTILVPGSPETPSPLKKRVSLEEHPNEPVRVKKSAKKSLTHALENCNTLNREYNSSPTIFLGEGHPLTQNRGSLQKISFNPSPEKSNSYLSYEALLSNDLNLRKTALVSPGEIAAGSHNTQLRGRTVQLQLKSSKKQY